MAGLRKLIFALPAPYSSPIGQVPGCAWRPRPAGPARILRDTRRLMMDKEEGKLRFLEGLGYVAAAMIGLGGVTSSRALYFFNVLGLVFAIIVIVRLMVMNVSLGLVQRLYEPPPDQDSALTDAEE